MKHIAVWIIVIFCFSMKTIHANDRDKSFFSALKSLSEISMEFENKQLDLETSEVIRKRLDDEVINKMPLEMSGIFSNLLHCLYFNSQKKRSSIYELAHASLTQRLLGEKSEDLEKIIHTFEVGNADGGWSERLSELREHALGEDLDGGE